MLLTKKICSTVATEDVINMTINECVTIQVKVVDVKVTKTVTNKYVKELTMQSMVIADNSGQCWIVLWENEIRKMELQKVIACKMLLFVFSMTLNI